jgi:hypothetical protein
VTSPRLSAMRQRSPPENGSRPRVSGSTTGIHGQLSVVATDWQPRERLSRMCTIPINGVLDQVWDTASFAKEAQIRCPRAFT